MCAKLDLSLYGKNRTQNAQEEVSTTDNKGTNACIKSTDT
jgi:hypothetical protein